MVNEFQYIGLFGPIDALLGFIVIDKNELRAGFDFFEVFRCGGLEIVQRILGFLIRFARSGSDRFHALLLLQVGIRNRSRDAVGIWGFMSDDENFAHD